MPASSGHDFLLSFLFSTWAIPYAALADRLSRRGGFGRLHVPALQEAASLGRAVRRGHAVTGHAMAGVHKLPDQDIDDQSLIFPTTIKR